jgi:hypothetical protein
MEVTGDLTKLVAQDKVKAGTVRADYQYSSGVGTFPLTPTH